MKKHPPEQIKRYRTRRKGTMRSARGLDKVDAVLVSKPSDVRYLSGLVEGSQNLLVGTGWSALYTHPMYRDRAPVECPGLDIEIPKKDFYKVMKKQLKGQKVKRLGVQKTHLNLATFALLEEHLTGIKLVPLDEFVAPIRAVKDDEEIRLTAKAVRIAEKAFREMTNQGAAGFIGRTERAIALELETRMIENGARGQAFPGGIIVAGGPHSAACHHIPTNRKVKEGDVLLIDWGAEVEGAYRSDQTRTLFMRKVPSRLESIYPIVQEGYQRAVDVTKPGKDGKALDKACRSYIDEQGYGYEFRHGLGHGVGIDIHEEPFLGRSKLKLKKNMVITIEPGIYFIGYGGIRLENMVLVTSDGAEVMNKLRLGLKQAVLP